MPRPELTGARRSISRQILDAVQPHFGGGSTQATATIAPQLAGLFQGSANRVLQMQKQSPLLPFSQSYTPGVAGTSGNERMGAGYIRSLNDTPITDAMGLRSVMNAPGAAGWTPTTGDPNGYQMQGSIWDYAGALAPNQPDWVGGPDNQAPQGGVTPRPLGDTWQQLWDYPGNTGAPFTPPNQEDTGGQTPTNPSGTGLPGRQPTIPPTQSPPAQPTPVAPPGNGMSTQGARQDTSGLESIAQQFGIAPETFRSLFGASSSAAPQPGDGGMVNGMDLSGISQEARDKMRELGVQPRGFQNYPVGPNGRVYQSGRHESLGTDPHPELSQGLDAEKNAWFRQIRDDKSLTYNPQAAKGMDSGYGIRSAGGSGWQFGQGNSDAQNAANMAAVKERERQAAMRSPSYDTTVKAPMVAPKTTQASTVINGGASSVAPAPINGGGSTVQLPPPPVGTGVPQPPGPKPPNPSPSPGVGGGGPNVGSVNAIEAQTSKPAQAGAPGVADSIGVTSAYKKVDGSEIENDPALNAANDYYARKIQPGIENGMALAGLGRTTAAGTAQSDARANLMLPLIQDANARAERTNSQGAQAVEAELQRRERGGVRYADALQNQAGALAGLGAARTGRQQSTMDAYGQYGGLERGIQQQRYDAQNTDYLRRQALSEQATNMPFGQTLPAAFGSNVSGGK